MLHNLEGHAKQVWSEVLRHQLWLYIQGVTDLPSKETFWTDQENICFHVGLHSVLDGVGRHSDEG